MHEIRTEVDLWETFGSVVRIKRYLNERLCYRFVLIQQEILVSLLPIFSMKRVSCSASRSHLVERRSKNWTEQTNDGKIEDESEDIEANKRNE